MKPKPKPRLMHLTKLTKNVRSNHLSQDQIIKRMQLLLNLVMVQINKTIQLVPKTDKSRLITQVFAPMEQSQRPLQLVKMQIKLVSKLSLITRHQHNHLPKLILLLMQTSLLLNIRKTGTQFKLRETSLFTPTTTEPTSFLQLQSLLLKLTNTLLSHGLATKRTSVMKPSKMVQVLLRLNQTLT